MASTPKTASTIDLSKASDAELKNIHSQVLSNLALRANDPSALADGYDRHGSGHSRSGGSKPVEVQDVRAKSVKAKAVK